MKCGSTSLHNYLDMHPEIQMSNPKEINFFSNNENYQKGLSWYSSFFEHGFKYNGESSINYSKRHVFPEVSKRILKDLGKDIKLIYIVRDPIDRIQSNFTDSKTYLDINSSYSINDFIVNKKHDNPFLKTSMYYYQMEAYLSDFEVTNMYFLKADDLKNHPQATMDKLFEFLGLNPVKVELKVMNQSNSKTYVSTRYLKLSQSPILKSLKKLLPEKVLSTIKENGAIKNMAIKTINPDLDVISPDNRTLLTTYLEDDMAKFEKLTKIKF